MLDIRKIISPRSIYNRALNSVLEPTHRPSKPKHIVSVSTVEGEREIEKMAKTFCPDIKIDAFAWKNITQNYCVR